MRPAAVDVSISRGMENAPAGGLDLELVGPDGAAQPVPLDGQGKAKADDLPAGVYELKLKKAGEG